VKSSRVSKRYAKALFDLALQQDELAQVEKDLQMLNQDLQNIAEFRAMITSPVISRNIKNQIISELYKKRLQVLTYQFIELLLQKKRENILADIIQAFQELLDEHRGIIRGEVRSYLPLSTAQVNGLKAQLDKIYGKNVQLNQKTDSNLLGGFTITIKDRVYDLSLRNKLESMRTALVGS
jgi:F-type H+-transporting ATPase subunit delta